MADKNDSKKPSSLSWGKWEIDFDRLADVVESETEAAEPVQPAEGPIEEEVKPAEVLAGISGDGDDDSFDGSYDDTQGDHGGSDTGEPEVDDLSLLSGVENNAEAEEGVSHVDAPPESGGEGRTEADVVFRAKMREISLGSTVAVFGFRASGKSWLLHRLRHHLVTTTTAELDPVFTELPEHGMAIKGTSEFEFHEVIDRPPWSMIDSPGEYSKLLIGGKVEEMWQMVHVLSQASAIIITIPSDVLVFGAQMDEAEIHTREDCDIFAKKICGEGANVTEIADLAADLKVLMDDFADLKNFAFGLYKAAAAVSYVRENGIDALDPEQYESVTWKNVKQHIMYSEDFKPVGGTNGLTCPAFIALTKTDRLISVMYDDQEIQGLSKIINKRKNEMLLWPQTKAMRALAEKGNLLSEMDKFPLNKPSQFVRALEKILHTRIVRYFPMSRFDFVSAFFGHDYSATLKFGHYKRHPALGVPEMHSWIRRALALSKKGDKRISRQTLARKIHFAIHGIPEPGAGSLEEGE